MISSINKLDNYTTDTQKKEIKKSLGKEDFLRLLVTQMQFQDPLKPMEHTEFTAQLAQFSSLDQLFAINDKLGALSDARGGLDRLQAINFIGKEVKASGNKVYMGKDASSTLLGYTLNKKASGVTIHIFDRNGTGLRTIEMGPQDAGVHSIVWDGRDDSGALVPSGEYTFSVSARDPEGKDSDVLTNVVGTVTGVSFEEAVPYLMVGGGIRIPVSNIREVKEVIAK